MHIEQRGPTDAEIDRANTFCHAFIRFLISEGVNPSDGVMYVAAGAAQVVKNAARDANMSREDILLMFMQNTVFFMGCMKEDGTVYPIPRKDL